MYNLTIGTVTRLIALFFLVALCDFKPLSAQSGTVRDIPLSGGGQIRVLFATVQSPRGVIVMLPGGSGDIGIEADGDL
jgi:hypothetical protein